MTVVFVHGDTEHETRDIHQPRPARAAIDTMPHGPIFRSDR